MEELCEYQALKDLIVENRLKLAFNKLRELVKSDKKLTNEIILHENQYNKNLSDEKMRIAKKEDLKIEEIRIKYNLLQIIDELKKKQNIKSSIEVKDNRVNHLETSKKSIQIIIEGFSKAILEEIRLIRLDFANRLETTIDNVLIKRIHEGSNRLIVELNENDAIKLLNYSYLNLDKTPLSKSNLRIISFGYFEYFPQSFFDDLLNNEFIKKHKLTKKELGIMQLISQKENNKEIARKLFISEQTVAVHRKLIMRKLKGTTFEELLKVINDNNLGLSQ